MIATASVSELVLKALAPLVWRNAAKVASKLEGFASTEAGSALDMLKAAELTDDPKLRWLFFRHAMDEARHARMFREAARGLCPEARPAASEYNLIHARRQNLFARMPLTEFIAFVYLAERRGELQFRALQSHFKDQPGLESLFARIGKDERFHVAYSQMVLNTWRGEGRWLEVTRALWKVRGVRAWEAWRRSGRILGDLTGRLLLGAIYLVVLPVFVLLARVLDPAKAGWKRKPALAATLEAARRQF